MLDSVELRGLLELAISPVILISAFLSMTNRLGRAIDRARVLYREAPDAQHEQIKRLLRRAKLIRSAILWNSLCMVGTAFLILVIFVFSLMGVNSAVLVSGLFIGSLLCLVAGLAYFIVDVYRGLEAVEIEVLAKRK